MTSSSFSTSSPCFRPPLSDASSQEQAGPSERGMRDLEFFFEDVNTGSSEKQQWRHRRKNQQQRRQLDVESLRGGGRAKVSGLLSISAFMLAGRFVNFKLRTNRMESR